MSAIVGERARIDDSAARKRKPCLARQERNALGRAKPLGVRATGEKIGLEQGGDVGCRYRAIRDAAGWGRNLDHRLEPIEAARSGAHDLDRNIARLRLA